jgi:glycosyltransferase 2 family protein
MHPRWKTIVVALAKFSIPVVIIGFLLSRIEPEDWEQFVERPKNYGLLFSALVVALVALSLSFFRWGILVRCQGIELSMLETFRLGSICYLLSFVSAGSVGGDLFKAIFLAQRRPGKRIEAVASVFVDRGVGMYGLVLLVTAAFFLNGQNDAGGDNLERIRLATLALVVVGTIVLLFLVLGGKIVDTLMKRLGKLRFVGPLFLRIAGPLRMFHSHPYAFSFSILLSVLVHAGLTFSIYLIAIGLYDSPPSLAEHFVIVPIGMIASALPIAPAGMGVLEATMEWLYYVIPEPATNASGTLVALVYELVKLITAAIGTLFYWTANEEIRHSIEVAEEECQQGD